MAASKPNPAYGGDNSVWAVIERISEDAEGLPGAPREKLEERVGERRVCDAIREGFVYEVDGTVKIARIRP